MDWLNLENRIGEKVKTILLACGYDRIISLLKNIEPYINFQCQNIAQQNCCHSDYYKIQSEFEMLPGQRDFILALSKYVSNNYICDYQEDSSKL